MALDELAEALRHDLADEHAAEAQRRWLDEAVRRLRAALRRRP